MTSDETIRKDVTVESLALRLWDEGLLRPEWQAAQVVTALLGWLEEDGLLAPAPLREEWGSEMRDARPEGGSLVLRARDPDNARWQIEHNPERATGRLVRRYVTDWEEA